ncbi:ABC transporter permease [Paenarthrobacter nicotinovorans]|uniref:ABC transporter permease n=1 Tax=Paenarthrobacter nicotinovorans TaxID=29320 RepID=UPI002486447C|nr:ABC transporter permease [Paenarthrobacter nicotinovorans]MDI2019754.1 Glutathione transport system permease protein GsiD [Paenarthrobacter nicotinovorans]
MTQTLIPQPPATSGRVEGRAPNRFRLRPLRPGSNIELLVGGGIFGIMVLAAVFAPLLTPYDPTAQDLANALSVPTAAHPLGTDNLGRDTWSRLLFGARSDLGIAVLAVIFPFFLGTILGALCGYFSGWLDTVVMRIADVVSAFPFFVLVITLVFVFGNGPLSIFLAISLVSWVSYARIVRAETLVIRSRDFIQSCQTGGLGTARIVVRHVLPNTATQAIVFAMSDVVGNIGVIVTLSYFGLGIIPPTPDWGQMISDGQQFLASGNYSLVLIPGAAVILASLSLTFLGDGIANALRAKR